MLVYIVLLAEMLIKGRGKILFMYVGREENLKREKISMTNSNIRTGEKIVRAAIAKSKVEEDNLRFAEDKKNLDSMHGIAAFLLEREEEI